MMLLQMFLSSFLLCFYDNLNYYFSLPAAPAEAAAVEEPPKAPTPPPPAGKVRVQALQ